ncbi:MAG: ATP-binding domain-containing protein [Anaerolineales bacterium]
MLTCFNYALAQNLSLRVPEGVSVFHFHGLCRAMADKAGFTLRRVQDPTEFYETVMPDALLEAIDRLGPQFDAVIVDEGQDFKDNWWLPLVSLLRDPERGILFAFYDDNQNLYRGFKDIPIPGVIDEAPFPLIDNCRNTQSIHHLVSNFHHDAGRLRCPGPPGQPPEVYEYADFQSQTKLLRKVLHRLVYEENVDCRDIVILTPRSPERTQLKDGLCIANFTLTAKPTQLRNHIQVSSVHTFKGLESRVVILAEVDAQAGRLLEAVLYVGCSRARTYLVVLVDEALEEGMRVRIRGIV